MTTAAAVLGALLIVPPMLNVFVQEGVIGGMPATLFYLFTGWLAIIVLVALLVRLHK
ncbi:hypothetical protein [Lentzea waywayandensis]|uniref:hypothetical protein n=1 Tax=Lentzea waywayandensis TaxID=84724 RepID=UPI0015A56FA3|nr:hypothetical protein [Lentzea waywayandensis]